MASLDLGSLMKKTLILSSLVTAKRARELQSLSVKASFVGNNIILAYVLEFNAKTESVTNPLLMPLIVKSLTDFVRPSDEECSLCLVRALRYYLENKKNVSNQPRTSFVSPSKPTKPISKNALSPFLEGTIFEVQAILDTEDPYPPIRAHLIKRVLASQSLVHD